MFRHRPPQNQQRCNLGGLIVVIPAQAVAAPLAYRNPRTRQSKNPAHAYPLCHCERSAAISSAEPGLVVNSRQYHNGIATNAWRHSRNDRCGKWVRMRKIPSILCLHVKKPPETERRQPNCPASRVPTFPKLSWRAQRGNLPQTVMASAARQSSPNCHCERSAAISSRLRTALLERDRHPPAADFAPRDDKLGTREPFW